MTNNPTPEQREQARQKLNAWLERMPFPDDTNVSMSDTARLTLGDLRTLASESPAPSQEIAAQQQQEIAELRRIGNQMANVFFSWSRSRRTIDREDRAMMRSLHQEWDTHTAGRALATPPEADAATSAGTGVAEQEETTR